MTYFTADSHFSHSRIIEYCRRPFSSAKEMDETLVKNWNEKVKPEDLVYHLGDFCFGGQDQILSIRNRLNGSIILIEGNHDRVQNPRVCGFKEKHKILEIKIDGISITLSHFAMRVWNKSHYNAWHFYGHSHGGLEPIGKSWDVGVDANNFYPMSFEEMKKIMDSRPDNFNFVGNR